MTKEKEPSFHCSLCGQDIWQMSKRGAYLHRTSPKGGPFVGECRPSCEQTTGNQDDALLAAIEDNEKCEHGKGLTEYCEPCGRINNE